MKKIDPRLRYLLRQREAQLEVAQTLESQQDDFTNERVPTQIKDAHKQDLPQTIVKRLESLLTEDSQRLESQQTVEVLVRCVGENALEKLHEIGMKTHFHIDSTDTIVSGEVELGILEKLNQLDCVAQVEASRPMVEELNISYVETSVHTVHQQELSVRGAGVIVGIIDTGIDYAHPSFRNDDDSSRILWLWDQNEIDPQQRPSKGRVYTKEELNKALGSSQPSKIVPHQDKDGHGTHVAGIAAGNGRASEGKLFTGIAADADLIVVALKKGKEKEKDTSKAIKGFSKSVFDALAYILEKANEKECPVVINLSQGINSGGHSAETLLERALDDQLRKPNVVVVKSAGNEQENFTHAGGEIAQGQEVELKLSVKSRHRDDDDDDDDDGDKYQEIIEVWYDGADGISIKVEPPDSSPLQLVKSGDRKEEFKTRFGNEITIDIDHKANQTTDTCATIFLSRGETDCIEEGTWKLWLHGERVQIGRYDAWIEKSRNGNKIQFTKDSADLNSTITIPGTARRVITVGSYVTRPQEGSNLCGEISSFSSRGPTRYGLQKPEIAAPGEFIISARSNVSNSPEHPDRWHTSLRGTSMAAPHVTGAAALILSVRPGLTCEQVKQIIVQTTRHDVSTSSSPDNTWGYGKLNIEAAVECARTVQFPQVLGVQVNGITISWQTDIPTTGTIHYHTNHDKLKLGNVVGKQEDQTLGTNHTLAFRELSPGTYYFEIVACSEGKWWTADDNVGDLYVVEVLQDNKISA